MTLTTEPDHALIEWISFKQEFPAEAEEAIRILYNRYKVSLLKILRKILLCRGVLESEVEDLANDTFYHIYSSCPKFSSKEDNSSKLFLYWLVKISKNLYYGIKNTEKETASHLSIIYAENDNYQDKALLIPFEEKPIFYNEQIIIDYLQALSERDREILLSYYDYYIPGKNTPHKVLNELANRHSTTIEYIRTIRNRLIRKIEKELQVKISIRN